MLTRPMLRWLLIPLFVVGLWPLIQMIALDAEQLRAVAPVAVALMGGSCAIAVVLTLGFLHLVGHDLRPLWVSIAGIAAIFLTGFTVAEFFGVIWLLPLFAIGWALSHWLLELRELIHGPLIGMIFIIARIAGMFVGALGMHLAGG